jgi:hypothetical protein
MTEKILPECCKTNCTLAEPVFAEDMNIKTGKVDIKVKCKICNKNWTIHGCTIIDYS